MSRALPLSISSWLTFACALTFYWLTVDPGISYWDCPEYVTVASRMEIGHPPGNPIWMLAMRVATMPFPLHIHALVINLWSGVFMAFAAFFLCRVIFVPVRTLLSSPKFGSSIGPGYADTLAAVIAFGASMSFALCDSAWFSAVEAEVYAMSTFLSALTLWIMTLWWHEKSPGRQTRLIILLSYLTGLSLGVHQLNLLLIPVFALVMFYKYHPNKGNRFAPFLVVTAACIGIGIILMGILPGILFGAASIELHAVNSWSWPYNLGAALFCILLFLLLSGFLICLPSKSIWSKGVWMLSFLLLGFSSFVIILIRAQANPPMNEGVPSDIFALKSYIERDQYPSSPLIYGETPYSLPMFEEKFIDIVPYYTRYILEKGKPQFVPVQPGALMHYRSGMVSPTDSEENLRVAQTGRGYLLADYSFKQKLTPELNMWFPRMTSRKVADRLAYADWAGMTEESMLRVPVSETVDSLGHYRTRMYPSGSRPEVWSYKPTNLQNLRFFVAYQSYYMYFRYLFWNFIGRQNDFPSTGEIEHGNFVTGISYIDSQWLGVTDDIPPEIWSENPGRNRYFGIPFALGILGIIWLACAGRVQRRYLALTVVLFLMTSLAIVAYLNQSPGEPRERDYTFLVSYMAFCMWIAAGSTAVASGCIGLFKNISAMQRLKGPMPKITVALTAALFALGVPALMAAENFDDHDRSGRYEPAFYVSSFTDFELPSIIFSHGDNYSFPLWYASEVLSQPSDNPTFIPVDITYLSLPWYIKNIKNQDYRGFNTYASSPEIAYGTFVLSRIPADQDSTYLPLDVALESLYSKAPELIASGEMPAFPEARVSIPFSPGDSVVINLRDFTNGSSFLPFRQLMLLDILASNTQTVISNSPNPRVLFFPYAIDYSFYKALEPALRPALFGKIYAPWLNDSSAHALLKNSIEREFRKLEDLPMGKHYIDPVIADRSKRYRGELILAAGQLLNQGDTLLAYSLIKSLLEKYPYSSLLPGDFTMADSTFYEGSQALKILKSLGDATGDSLLIKDSRQLRQQMELRHNQWLRYYHSLSPLQRATLSNRSRRLLIPPQ